MFSFLRNFGPKTVLFSSMLLFGVVSMLYTNWLVGQLADEEQKFISIWAEATREIQVLEETPASLLSIINQNTTIPVILVGDQGEITTCRNFPESKLKDPKFLVNELAHMDSEGRPIVIELADGKKNYVYYKESKLITQLSYYPYVQIGIVAFFLILTYFAISSTRRAEQNQVWVGMSKETAHQLGTPIQSLVAWIELLKLQGGSDEMVVEVEKDVRRLEIITERFSKIGSIPNLKAESIGPILENAVNYLRNRSSKNVSYNLILNDVHPDTKVPMNRALFEWVIENICKNAIDAMNGRGRIIISLVKMPHQLAIDISDTGKGMPKRLYKRIFRPGFTTKKRGWGLGLSLVKRIVEQYHAGKIFVKTSVPGKGTTFRITLQARFPTGKQVLRSYKSDAITE